MSTKGHTKGAYSRSIGRQVPPSVSVPPMPLLHRRLAIHSTPQGLVARPYISGSRGHYSGQNSVRIAWGSLKPELLEEFKEEEEGDGLVVDGLAGILEGFQGSFLLVITESAVVATLPDSQKSKINVANSVIAVPLSSHEAARAVLVKYAAKQAGRRRATSVSSVSTAGTSTRHGKSADDTDDESSSSEEEEADAAPAPSASIDPKRPRPFWQRSFRFGNAKTPAPPPAAVEEVATAEQSTPASDPPSSDATPSGSPDPNKAASPSGSDAPKLSSVAAAATHVDGATDEEVRASQRELDQKLVAECLRYAFCSSILYRRLLTLFAGRSLVCTSLSIPTSHAPCKRSMSVTPSRPSSTFHSGGQRTVDFGSTLTYSSRLCRLEFVPFPPSRPP